MLGSGGKLLANQNDSCFVQTWKKKQASTEDLWIGTQSTCMNKAEWNELLSKLNNKNILFSISLNYHRVLAGYCENGDTIWFSKIPTGVSDELI